MNRTVGLLRKKDPVCDEWQVYADALNAGTADWNNLNRSKPALQWDARERRVFESSGLAMARAADEFESLLPKAENVVIQELISQTVVYYRKYVESLPVYVEADRYLANVAVNFGNTVTYICSAVPLVPPAGEGEYKKTSDVERPADLVDFMPKPAGACAEYEPVLHLQNTVLGGWAETDSAIPAAQWTAQERALNNAAREVLLKDSETLHRIALSQEASIFYDLILLQSAYMRAYADAIPTYTPNDNWLWKVATGLGGGLIAACRAG